MRICSPEASVVGGNQGNGLRGVRLFNFKKAYYYYQVAKMREAIMMDQDEFLVRTSDLTEAGLEGANATFLEDVAQNADLYIANQSGNM